MRFKVEDADWTLKQHIKMGLELGPKTTISSEDIPMISIKKANAKLDEWGIKEKVDEDPLPKNE